MMIENWMEPEAFARARETSLVVVKRGGLRPESTRNMVASPQQDCKGEGSSPLDLTDLPMGSERTTVENAAADRLA